MSRRTELQRAIAEARRLLIPSPASLAADVAAVEADVNVVEGEVATLGTDLATVETDVAILDTEKVDFAGQIGGSVSLPDIRGIRTTTGPTLLTIGAIADGEYLRRVGATVVSGAPSGGGLSDGDYGDITVGGTGTTMTIDNNAVNFAKIQDITDARLLGRSAGSDGDMQYITVGAGLSLAAGALTGTGEANTYSNGGTGGIGIVLTKVGVDLPFKSIAAASSKITISNDAPNNRVSVDLGAVAESDITNLTSDLAARVQIGGQLGGTPTVPTVLGIRETSGPTNLTVGTIADGEYLKRSGSTLTSGTPSGGPGGGATMGTAVLDFGATPAEEASIAVTGQAGIVAGSHVWAFFMREATGDNSLEEHEEAAALCPVVCGEIVAGTGFTARAHPIAMLGLGTFNLHWGWQ